MREGLFLQKILIIPRGIAALGYTMQLPTDDRFLLRRTELEKRIATLLGGRAAEAIIFKDVSTRAQNDLSRATDIARSMVAEYGMSQKLGQVYYAPQRQQAFLNTPGGTGTCWMGGLKNCLRARSLRARLLIGRTPGSTGPKHKRPLKDVILLGQMAGTPAQWFPGLKTDWRKNFWR